jgi:non-ribosomal peptide synthetase component E (peptide arylation enzyme)
MVLSEVLEQARPGRLPSEQFPGHSGRGGAVQGHEVAQVAEVLTGIGGGHGRRGDPEVAAHRQGDLAEGDALVGDRVQDRAGGGGLDGQAGQARGVGAVHFLGYLSPADNRAAFVEGGWFRTGDLGVIDRGRLTITGRAKEIVARKGMKISLAEVDEAVLALPGVEEAASYGVPDSQTGERLALAVRCRDPATEFDAIAGRLLAGGLAKWKLPEQVVFWDEPLPRTASGKIQRQALADGGRGRPSGMAPRLRDQHPRDQRPRDQEPHDQESRDQEPRDQDLAG